jgi:hypothetical protein
MPPIPLAWGCGSGLQHTAPHGHFVPLPEPLLIAGRAGWLTRVGFSDTTMILVLFALSQREKGQKTYASKTLGGSRVVQVHHHESFNSDLPRGGPTNGYCRHR